MPFLILTVEGVINMLVNHILSKEVHHQVEKWVVLLQKELGGNNIYGNKKRF